MIEVEIGEAASYAAAGVDIHAGDNISRLWFEASAKTYSNRQDQIGHLAVAASRFSGTRGFDLDFIQGKFGLILNAGVDGVGTKTELAERAQALKDAITTLETRQLIRDHSGIFHDVIAMTADDQSRDGLEPFALATLFDVNSLKIKDDPDLPEAVVRQLTEGLVSGAKAANLVVINGETAELGERVGGFGVFNYNLGGFALGVGHRSRILDGSKVRPGNKIVAVREHSFRSNGMSLVRKILEAEYGPDWHLAYEDGEEPLVSQALRPSAIFTSAFVDLHGGYDLDREPKADVNALVHVTGGGMPGKLQRILAVTGYGAVIDEHYAPSPVMRRIQEISLKHADKGLATDDASAHQSLNEGNGAFVITDDEDRTIATLEAHGHEARVAGEVVELSGIQMKSKGVTHEGEWMHFIPKAA